MTELLSDLWLRFSPVEKIRAGDVPNGTIVRFKGDWGVKEGKFLDRWIGGPLLLSKESLVEVPAPKKRKKG